MNFVMDLRGALVRPLKIKRYSRSVAKGFLQFRYCCLLFLFWDQPLKTSQMYSQSFVCYTRYSYCQKLLFLSNRAP